jgi:AP-4 complex subunit epsilon-1
MNEEAIPAVWDLIIEKLEDKDAYIRKKAVMAVKRVIQVDSSRAEGLALSLKKALCDRDPSVMGNNIPQRPC